MSMQHPDSAIPRQPIFDPYDLGVATVADVMSRETLTVREDATVESIRALFLERGVGGAAVVDARGKVLGVVTLTDLVRHQVDGDEADDRSAARRLSVRTRRGYRYDLPEGFHDDTPSYATAADVMTPFAFMLPASAPIAQAAALMAYEGIQRVVVVSDEGLALGTITALDVTSFVARKLGLMPPHALAATPPTRPALLTRDRGLTNDTLRPSVAKSTMPAPRESGEFAIGTRRDVA